MHFNAALIVLLAAAIGVTAGELEDRTYKLKEGKPPVCAELCFQKAIKSSQCGNQKHYLRNLKKNYDWGCLCK